MSSSKASNVKLDGFTYVSDNITTVVSLIAQIIIVGTK